LDITFRLATTGDVPTIIALLQDDTLGAKRETSEERSLSDYVSAFAVIDADPNNEIWLIDLDGEIAGTFQLTFIPGLSRRGAWRCQIEAVRVDRRFRSNGIGSTAMHWAIARAKDKGCRLVQLTSDVGRTEAHQFYERLGFSKSHAGFKLTIA
jgi:GNAT superfamily N-acetyltransferase